MESANERSAANKRFISSTDFCKDSWELALSSSSDRWRWATLALESSKASWMLETNEGENEYLHVSASTDICESWYSKRYSINALSSTSSSWICFRKQPARSVSSSFSSRAAFSAFFKVRMKQCHDSSWIYPTMILNKDHCSTCMLLHCWRKRSFSCSRATVSLASHYNALGRVWLQTNAYLSSLAIADCWHSLELCLRTSFHKLIFGSLTVDH